MFPDGIKTDLHVPIHAKHHADSTSNWHHQNHLPITLFWSPTEKSFNYWVQHSATQEKKPLPQQTNWKNGHTPHTEHKPASTSKTNVPMDLMWNKTTINFSLVLSILSIKHVSYYKTCHLLLELLQHVFIFQYFL